MATTYKGNEIGTSKVQGILSKYDKEGSDLKLLRFGDFLKGSEPFITKDINTGEPFDRDTWVRMYLNNSSMAARKRIEDTARITKFVASPRGVLWEADMAALEAIQKSYNQKHQQKIDKIRSMDQSTSEGENFWKNLGSNLLNTAANLGKSALQGIGLTAATLTQVAASGTGFHNDTYISRAYLKDAGGESGGTLNTILSYAGVTTGGGVNGAAAVVGGAQTVVGSPDPDKLMVPDEKTEGREGSVTDPVPELFYGTKPRGRATPRDYKGEMLGSQRYGAFDLHGVTRTTKTSEIQRGPGSMVAEADRTGLKEEQFGRYGGITDPSQDLNADKLEGEATRVAKYFDTEDNRYLNVNARPVLGLSKDTNWGEKDRIFTLDYKEELPWYSVDSDNDLKFDESRLKKDLGLIPFCITTITPDHRTYLNFPAYLDSYDDSYTGDWDSVQYIGRAEKFYGYKGFTRSINLSFKVLARRESQVEPLYRNLNRLVGATAPSYGEGNVFMRGTLASLTIGGYHKGALLKEQLGFIPNIKLGWEIDYPWEIGKKDGEDYLIDSTKFVVPLVLNVSMQFTPIEKQEVREDYGGYFVFEPDQKTKASTPKQTQVKQKQTQPEPKPSTRRSIPELETPKSQGDTLTHIFSGQSGGHAQVGYSFDSWVNHQSKPVGVLDQSTQDYINALRRGGQ